MQDAQSLKALRDRPWKIERLGHDHFTGFVREVKRHVVPEHTSMIIRRLADNGRSIVDALAMDEDVVFDPPHSNIVLTPPDLG